MMTSPSMLISTWRMASLSKSFAVLLSALLLFIPIGFHPPTRSQAHHPFAVFQFVYHLFPLPHVKLHLSYESADRCCRNLHIFHDVCKMLSQTS